MSALVKRALFASRTLTRSSSRRRFQACRNSKAIVDFALTPMDLARAVHDNLRNLRVDVLDVVNLRVGGMDEPNESSIEEQLRRWPSFNGKA